MRLLASSVLGVLLVLAVRGGATVPVSYEDRAVDLLRRYLQVDTTVPPGNELRGAHFFRDVLAEEGIAAELDEFAPGRANLLARLPGNGRKRALILMNHIDVVPADPARWSVPPFGGVLRDGTLYGRGAQDMKAEGVIQLLAFIRARRERLALDRDILFLATADEEEGYAGALRALSAEGWRDRLAAAEYLITEGGENILDDSGRPLYFGVGAGEKGPFWLKLRTSGTPGHGSRPIADSAVNRLVEALDRVRRHQTRMKVLPSVARFLRDQAARVPEPRASWYRDLPRALADPAARRALYEDRETSALLRNTISITVVKAGYKTNVIPGTAEAELDVRLLPGEDPQAFLAELRRVIEDPQVEIVTPATFRTPNESPVDTELFRVFERVLARRYPGVPVTTKLLSGATESVLFRPAGVAAYGFTTLLTTSEELASAHGDDERIRVADLRQATGLFYEVVREACAAP